MKLKVRDELIFVEKLNKAPKKKTGTLLVEAQVSDSSGIIRNIGTEYKGDLQVGMQVYYGRDRQEIRMSGVDILIMKPENVVAIVEE